MLHAILLVFSSIAQDPQELVTKLSDRQYFVRDDAQNALSNLRDTAGEFVKNAAGSTNPEVRIRAGQIIQKWKEEDLWKASRVEVGAGTALADAVEKVHQQTDLLITLGDNYSPYSDGQIDTDLPQQFWPAVDAICKVTGNKIRPHYNNQASIALYTGVEKCPIAYNGPFRLCVLSSRVMFSEELDYEDGSNDVTHSFEMRLGALWESKLNIVAFRPQLEVVRATTSAGNLLATQPAAVGWTLAGTAKQSQFTLHLHPPANSATRLDELTVKWGVAVVGDYDYLDVGLAKSSAKEKSDIECTLLDYEKAADRRYTAEIMVTRSKSWEPDMAQANFDELRIELLDSNGVPLRKTGQTNSVVDGLHLALTFIAMEENTDPRTLRVHYPRVRSRRDVLFTFKDVKIANGRP